MEQKIFIPKKGVFRVYRNELQIDPETTLLEKIEGDYGFHYKEPMKIFSADKHYILQIPKTVNKVNYTQANFWENLNIGGTLEVQSHCPIEVRHSGSCVKEEYTSGITKWKHVIFNCPETFVSFQLTERKVKDPTTNKQESYLESAVINSNKCAVYLENLPKLTTIEINSKNSSRIHIQCPNLKELKMPNMEHLQITEYKYSSGFDLFATVDEYYDEDENNEKHSPVIPDNCVITLNQKLKISANGHLTTVIKSLNEDIGISNLPVLDLFDQNKTKTFKLNANGTFSISAWEFKKCFAEYVVSKVAEKAKQAQEKIYNKYKDKMNKIYDVEKVLNKEK